MDVKGIMFPMQTANGMKTKQPKPVEQPSPFTSGVTKGMVRGMRLNCFATSCRIAR